MSKYPPHIPPAHLLHLLITSSILNSTCHCERHAPSVAFDIEHPNHKRKWSRTLNTFSRVSQQKHQLQVDIWHTLPFSQPGAIDCKSPAVSNKFSSLTEIGYISYSRAIELKFQQWLLPCQDAKMETLARKWLRTQNLARNHSPKLFNSLFCAPLYSETLENDTSVRRPTDRHYLDSQHPRADLSCHLPLPAILGVPSTQISRHSTFPPIVFISAAWCRWFRGGVRRVAVHRIKIWGSASSDWEMRLEADAMKPGTKQLRNPSLGNYFLTPFLRFPRKRWNCLNILDGHQSSCEQAGVSIFVSMDHHDRWSFALSE